MELHLVTISSNGGLDPAELSDVHSGDIVAFQANGTDAVLCFDMAALFGTYRYEIADGATLPLVVLAEVEVETTVSYTVKTEEGLGAECFPRSNHEGHITLIPGDRGEEGGGSSGGGE